VGKIRDEARHTIKKMTKEICKLFSKKFSIDVAEGTYIQSDFTKIIIAPTLDFIAVHMEVIHLNVDLKSMLFPVFVCCNSLNFKGS
jgi:hypothetical protein